jgi:hypothetical protein
MLDHVEGFSFCTIETAGLVELVVNFMFFGLAGEKST